MEERKVGFIEMGKVPSTMGMVCKCHQKGVTPNKIWALHLMMYGWPKTQKLTLFTLKQSG